LEQVCRRLYGGQAVNLGTEGRKERRMDGRKGLKRPSISELPEAPEAGKRRGRRARTGSVRNVSTVRTSSVRNSTTVRNRTTVRASSVRNYRMMGYMYTYKDGRQKISYTCVGPGSTAHTLTLPGCPRRIPNDSSTRDRGPGSICLEWEKAPSKASHTINMH
jgi:hypothetical protein